MNNLSERIREYADAKPEATPIRADDLLLLGDRAAVVQSLSRLVHSERLLRICDHLKITLMQPWSHFRAAVALVSEIRMC